MIHAPEGAEGSEFPPPNLIGQASSQRGKLASLCFVSLRSPKFGQNILRVVVTEMQGQILRRRSETQCNLQLWQWRFRVLLDTSTFRDFRISARISATTRRPKFRSAGYRRASTFFRTRGGLGGRSPPAILARPGPGGSWEAQPPQLSSYSRFVFRFRFCFVCAYGDWGGCE